jgi:Cu(I)/Ag(I) efflux system periplasmic protein CusF
MKGNHMKSIISTVLVVAALAFGAGAQAQMAPMAAASGTKATAPAEFTNAEIRKIDKETKKVTLKHEEIKNLGMPPMSMVFEVKDGGVLDKFKAGDKVRFKAISDSGKYIVTEIQPAK